MSSLISQLPPELVGFVLTLALSLLIGFEREEHEPEGIGGVRTFPLMGLGGYVLVIVFPDSAVPFAVGLVVLGGLLALTHQQNVLRGEPGLTTEVAALLVFTLGAGIARGHYWIAIAAAVVGTILLQEKRRLEGLVERVPRAEVATLLRFLLVIGVILPIVPDRELTTFRLNPFTIWLVVVAVSAVSYVSYLLRLRWQRGGLLLTGILGGAYSSTVTTVVLARSARAGTVVGRAVVGAIVAATGVMYMRLWLLVLLFAPVVASRLAVAFLLSGAAGIAVGAMLCRRRPDEGPAAPVRASNPLELTSAVAFAVVFTAVLVVTRLVAGRFGGAGVVVLAAVMGAADVDPFILGVAQQAGATVPVGTAALAVAVAAGANNVLKGVYARAFGGVSVGLLPLAWLAGLGALALVVVLVAA